MYKKIAIAALIAAPLIADLAARHSRTQAAAAVETNGSELPSPPPTPSAPVVAMAHAPLPATTPMQGQEGATVAGIDPTPALDPTPHGGSGMDSPPPAPPTPPPVAPQPPAEADGAVPMTPN